jgi:solute:Na+ symporter, SSS family
MPNFALLVFILLYLFLTVLVGWWSSRFVKNTRDFVIGGRQMPMLVVASGLFATWFGSETVMGATTEFVDKGVLGIIEEPFGAALCLFLIGIFMARPLYKLNLLTFSAYFRQRFDARIETASALMMIPSYFGWIAAQLIALATVMQVITGLPMAWGMLLCAALVMGYTYIGGMWAVSITDTIQTIMIVLGMLIVLFISLDKAGGWQHVVAAQPEGFFRFTPEHWTMKGSATYFAAWITVGLGSIPQQDVFQRVMSARSERAAVGGAFLSAAMYVTIAVMPLAIALCGKILYPELLRGDNAQKQLLIPMMVLQHGSWWLQIVFFGALLSAILSTTSGAILAPATVIGENLVKPRYPDLTDKQLLWVMRLSVVGVTVVSVLIGFAKSSIFELVSMSSAISLVSLFVPLVFGLYWRRANALGALWAMLGGFGAWAIATALETEASYPAILYGLTVSISGMLLGSWWKFSLPTNAKK